MLLRQESDAYLRTNCPAGTIIEIGKTHVEQEGDWGEVPLLLFPELNRCGSSHHDRLVGDDGVWRQKNRENPRCWGFNVVRSSTC